MSVCLYAEAEPTKGLLPFLGESWLLLLPPVLGFVAIYLLLPRVRRFKPVWGGVLAGLALVLGALLFFRNETAWPETLLFYAFAGVAVVAGLMMITQSNPVHAALSFALVVLSSCGLFLLQAAPFLMAATIIVYAGAIVVTFLFVVMLAQQEGPSSADQRSREPFLASLAGCVLMAALLCILQKTYNTGDLDRYLLQVDQVSKVQDDADAKKLLGDPAAKKDNERELELAEQLKKQFGEGEISVGADNLNRSWIRLKADGVEPLKKNAQSLHAALQARRQLKGSIPVAQVPGKKKDSPGQYQPGKLPAANVAALGRTLFTDYLLPIELAAVLLLVATIGAIVIAGRRSEELR